MLEKILGTAARISLLRVALSRKNKTMSVNEFAREAGLSTSTAFKEVKNLLGPVLTYDPVSRKYGVKDTPLTELLEDLFNRERDLFERGGLFEHIAWLGSYYVSGTAAILLRGLARDFTTAPDSIMVVCDRKVAKFRGALMSLFPSYRLLFVEDRIRPSDFVEGEIYFEGRRTKANLAVLEKAVVDTLWKYRWEGDSVAHAVHLLMDQPLDMNLLERYAEERGGGVPDRLKLTVGIIAGAGGFKHGMEESGRPGRVDKNFRRIVEKEVERAIGS